MTADGRERSAETRTLTSPLPDDVVAGLRALGDEHGLPAATVVLSGLVVVLARYSGSQDVPVAVPLGGGASVIRIDCSGDPRFSDFLARVQQAHSSRQVIAGQVAGSDTPLTELGSGPPGRIGFRADPAQDPAFDRNLDLCWHAPACGPDAARLALHVLYRCDLYDTAPVGRLLESLERVLAAACAEPGTRLSRLPVVGVAERRRLTTEWNDNAVELRGSLTMPGLFAEQVTKTPDHTALVVGARRLSYRDLDDAAASLARRLLTSGVQRGQPIGVCARAPEEMVIGILGVLKAGAAYLPLDPDYPADRLAYMLEDSRSGLVVTGTGVEADIPGHVATVRVDGPERPTRGSTRPAADVVFGSSDLAYVIYTSGSTGRPKGAAIPHGAVAALATGLRTALNDERIWADGASTLLASSFSFDVSIRQMIMMFTGVTLHILDKDARRSTAEVARYIRDQRLDSFAATPTRLQLMIDDGVFASAREHPVCALIGGEAISPELWNRLRSLEGVAAFNHYGPTECTNNSSVTPVAGDVPVVGAPIPNTRYYVLDPDRALVPAGSVGELYIGGSGVSHGYLNHPGLTAERFVPDPFGRPGARLYRTGDLVRQNAKGDVEFLGRTDDQVKIRGFRVELGEIASALLRHPAVADAAVLVREDRLGDKRLVGYVTPAASHGGVTVGALREHLATILPDFMLPNAIVVVNRMPVDPNGKLDRRALPSPDLERDRTDSLFIAPRTPREELVAGVWADVLGLTEIGVFDNFFELGGHSLLAGQVIARIRDECRVEMRLRVLFENPTVAGLTEKIGEAAPATAPIISRRAPGRHPVS